MTLDELLARLRAAPRVRGVLLTGSAVTGLGPASDLDLAVVLDRNDEGLRTVFTMIEGRFGDLYVFDVPFVEAIRTANAVAANSWEAIFAARLHAGRIEHDPDGVLVALQRRLIESPFPVRLEESVQRRIWLKLNYDLAANVRYASASDPAYRRALEIRLLYGVMDAVTAYFAFRGMAWEGEKAAVRYFDDADPEFGAILTECLRGGSLETRMPAYVRLVAKVWHGPFQPWSEGFLVPGDVGGGYAPSLSSFWKELLGEGG